MSIDLDPFFKKEVQEVEKTILIENIRKNISFSAVFRTYLISVGYEKLSSDIKNIKGEFCYDSYYKDFLDASGKLKYTTFCYCYDFREVIDSYEKYQFIFEAQVECGRGILGIESIQWESENLEESIINIKYFEDSTEKIYKSLGEYKLPEIK